MLRVGLPKPSLFRLIPPVMLILYKKLPFNWISPLSERLTAPFSYPSLVLLDSHRVRFHLFLFISTFAGFVSYLNSETTYLSYSSKLFARTCLWTLFSFRHFNCGGHNLSPRNGIFLRTGCHRHDYRFRTSWYHNNSTPRPCRPDPGNSTMGLTLKFYPTANQIWWTRKLRLRHSGMVCKPAYVHTSVGGLTVNFRAVLSFALNYGRYAPSSRVPSSGRNLPSPYSRRHDPSSMDGMIPRPSLLYSGAETLRPACLFWLLQLLIRTTC